MTKPLVGDWAIDDGAVRLAVAVIRQAVVDANKSGPAEDRDTMSIQVDVFTLPGDMGPAEACEACSLLDGQYVDVRDAPAVVFFDPYVRDAAC